MISKNFASGEMTEPISTGEMAANLLARLAVTEARAERAEAEAAMLRKALEKVDKFFCKKKVVSLRYPTTLTSSRTR